LQGIYKLAESVIKNKDMQHGQTASMSNNYFQLLTDAKVK